MRQSSTDELEQRLARLRRLRATRAETRRAFAGAAVLGRYRYDLVAFAHDCIDWGDGGPAPYQDEIWAELVSKGRAAVRGPHTLGKTTMAAIAVLWFALTRDGDDGNDWKTPTTASAWYQLTHYLWPEVHKWTRLLRWDVLGRDRFADRRELLDLSLQLSTGEAFAITSSDSARLEGAHAGSLLYVFDEAKSIPDDIFDAAEGAFAGAGADTPAEAYALAISTPGEPHGRFHEIHARKPGTEDWWVRHVTKDEAIASGRMSGEWAAKRALQWGVDSAVYQNRVLGEFAAADEDGVIPLAWVEAANDRWRAWDEAGRPGAFEVVGVDVARSGEDRTVLAEGFRHRDLRTVATLRYSSREDTTQTTSRVESLLRKHDSHRAVVDVIGIGAGVYDQLRQTHKGGVTAFNASERTDRRDRSREWGFVNTRAAAWWNLRELLEPANGEEVALPPDDELTGDLTAPRWWVAAGARIQIESKDDIRKRLGRSTDAGDAVVQRFWTETRPTRSYGRQVADARL